MSTAKPLIERVVTHLGGPTATADLIKVAYQEVQRWVSRGWVAPRHAVALEPHLPKGITLRSLLLEVQQARTKPGPAPKRRAEEAVACGERRSIEKRRDRPG